MKKKDEKKIYTHKGNIFSIIAQSGKIFKGSAECL